MKCTTCDADLEPGAAFCANCGTRAPAASSAGSPTVMISNPYETRATPEVRSPSTTQAPTATPPAYTPPAYTPQPIAPATPAYSPQPYPSATPATSTAATISLVFGILSWIALPLIGSIVAIVAGHMARREIQASNNQLGGSGLALAGLILGYAQVAIGLLACAGFVLLAILGVALGSTSP